MGLLGRLKLLLRSSQFHKRRRLNGNRFAVAPAFEGLEVRSLLSGTALGGNVFTPVDYAQLPSFEVSGTTIIGNQVLVHGTNADGHGEVASLDVTDALFSDPQTLSFLSEWEKTNPGALSHMDVKGAYMGPNGVVFVSESATTANASLVKTTLQDGNTTRVLDLKPGTNTYVAGVANSGDLALYAGGSFVFTNNQVIASDNGSGTYASVLYGIGQSGNIAGGTKIDVDFSSSVQIWKVSDGSMIDTYVDNSSIHYEGLRNLKETSGGFTGTSTVLDNDGNYYEVVVSLSPANGGYRINGLSTPFAGDTIKGVQEIGSSIYFVTDGPESMDSTIRVIGSNDTISVAALLGDLTGVTDVIVNSSVLDPSGRVLYLQGYSQKASGDESWLLSLALDPEVPAKPVPNFQNIPFKNGVQSPVSLDAVDGAASYVVQVNNLTTRTVERKVTVSVTQLAVTLANAGSYAIWVQAVGATGKAGPWSDATRFTVVPRPPAISYETDTFRWTDIGASQYDLWVNNQSGQRVVNQQTSATSFTASLPPGTYTAWVKPDADAWSTPYRIAVNPTFVSGTSHDLSSLTGLSSGNFRVWVRAVSDGSAGLFGASLWGYAKAFTV